MRSLSDLIVLIRGAGEVGSAIAHKLYRSHFRVCLTEEPNSLAINRGTCFSEAIYNSKKMVEGVIAEKATPALDQIYRVWRNDHIPILVDPELITKALIKPDVLINAMMLKRRINTTRMEDAPLVIGIGPGFTIGREVHLIIETSNNRDFGRVIIEGESADGTECPGNIDVSVNEKYVTAEDAGVFRSDNEIGDAVKSGDIIGYLDDSPLTAPVSGTLRGLLRSDVKVLANTRLAGIDPDIDKPDCYTIHPMMRTIAGGTLEAILMSLNIEETL